MKGGVTNHLSSVACRLFNRAGLVILRVTSTSMQMIYQHSKNARDVEVGRETTPNSLEAVIAASSLTPLVASPLARCPISTADCNLPCLPRHRSANRLMDTKIVHRATLPRRQRRPRSLQFRPFYPDYVNLAQTACSPSGKLELLSN